MAILPLHDCALLGSSLVATAYIAAEQRVLSATFVWSQATATGQCSVERQPLGELPAQQQDPTQVSIFALEFLALFS